MHLRISLLALALLSCSSGHEPAPGSEECKFKGGRIERDLTLHASCGPYTIKGGIDVLENVTLTLQPGVELRFGDGDWLEISAASTQHGRLIARGTASQPIVLTSIEPETAKEKSWLGLWFAAGTRDSVLSHVTIRAAGGNNTYLKPPLVQGCLTITDVAANALTLEHVRLSGCNNAGVVLRGAAPSLRDIDIDDTPVGFLLDGLDLTAVPDDVRYERVPARVVQGRSTL
ncbi:MAG TPA: hypothetical protein VJV78_29995 [Polyangiales bacterium]|nr:hypothetical protein [Polyangiales bacterium]